jgi:GDP-4-dehydro-6-deoxy-D-mannose reductase
MPKRVLAITGSNGFVGQTIMKIVMDHHADDFHLTDFIDPDTGQNADVRDAKAVHRTISNIKPDCLIHLAAVAAPRSAQNDPSSAWEVNLMGTLNVAQAILQHCPSARMVWSGSSEAYGNSFNLSPSPISETAALEPLNAYGATKAAADILLRQMAFTGLNVVIFRPFNHTGPGQSMDYVVPAFASQIAKIEANLQPPVINIGNLEARRDFLHVNDVVNAYLLALSKPLIKSGNRYNISTGQPITISYILEYLLSLSKIDIAVNVDRERFTNSPVPTATGSFKSLHNDYGWSPSITIEDTLNSVLNFERDKYK